MATTKTFSLLCVVVIAVLALATTTVSGRPCKTLFYFSATTTTTTYYPTVHSPNKRNPYHYTLIFTTTRRFPNPLQPANYVWKSSEVGSDSESDFPRKLSSSPSVSSSVKDRTRDIMSVVGALAFGVGCGALTAAIIYFLWALFSPTRYEFDEILSSSDDDDNDDDDDVAAMKKKLGGYVAIPAKEAAVDDDVKKPAAHESA